MPRPSVFACLLLLLAAVAMASWNVRDAAGVDDWVDKSDTWGDGTPKHKPDGSPNFQSDWKSDNRNVNELYHKRIAERAEQDRHNP